MIKMRSILIVLFMKFYLLNGFALPGKFDVELDMNQRSIAIPNRGFYNGTQVQIKISCNQRSKVKLGWLLRLSECIDEFYVNSESLPQNIFQQIYLTPNIALHDYPVVRYKKKNPTLFECEDVGYIIDLYNPDDLPIIEDKVRDIERPKKNDTVNSITSLRRKRAPADSPPTDNSTTTSTSTTTTIKPTTKIQIPPHEHQNFETIAKTWQDGAYMFIFYTEPENNEPYSLKMTISFKYKNGYLSANDWPLLPFYAVMCTIYSLYALFWFVCSFCYWRDLIRIQIWIGAVILLGLMEKAAYLAEYEQIDKNGYNVKVAMLIAEIISCFKRSLARMLVIIVSLGFGIVKPRLGPTMQKVVGVGALYFVFALVDGVFWIRERKEDTDSKGVLVGVPLVFIDVSICYWILANLQQTMRTLRVRRNIPELRLYRHFTYTLIFCVISSIIFMVWSLMRHRFVNCLKDWKELWLDEAFWHILFSFILLIIIILWRPSINSQRFAFTPLIENEDYDDDDEDQENEIFDSVKMRSKSNHSSQTNLKALAESNANQKASIEEDLKWVEENVPATLAETALPNLADSEEELMTTRFEISKMD